MTASRKLRHPAGVVAALILGLVVSACQSQASPPSSAGSSTQATNPQPSPSIDQGPTIAAIKARGSLRVGYAIAAPWILQDPATNSFQGPNYAIAKAIADGLGVKLDMIENDWSLFVAGLQADKYDIVSTGLFATAARLQVVDFVNFASSGQCYVVKANDTKIQKVSDLDNPSVTIGVVAGGGGDLISKAHPLAKIDMKIASPGTISRIDDLLAGRIEVTFIDSPLGPAIAERYPDLRIVPGPPAECVKNPDVPIPVGVSLPKGEDQFKAYVTQVITGMQSEIDSQLLQFAAPQFVLPSP